MSFSYEDLRRNEIAKKLDGLLIKIDPKVRWVDYIPGAALRTGMPLIAIGFVDNVKYVDIYGLSPFKIVNRVLNAMDDYCLEVQFLNNRQMREIEEDLGNLALDRTAVSNEVTRLLESRILGIRECTDIAIKAQKKGIFPRFFPDNSHAVVTAEMLSKYLQTTRATFVDTQLLSDLVKDTVKEREKVRFAWQLPLISVKESQSCDLTLADDIEEIHTM